MFANTMSPRFAAKPPEPKEDGFRRTVISKPGAAITETLIEIPPAIQQAISDALEKGRQQARRERFENPVLRFSDACKAFWKNWRGQHLKK